MTFVQTVLCVSLVVYPLTTLGNGEDAVVRIELSEDQLDHDVFKKERSPEDSLDHVTAFVELNRVQSNPSQGIVFMVDIVNKGHEAVELLDPTELLDVHLVNHEGWVCSRPRVPTMSMINTGDPEGTRAALDARRAFVIEKEPLNVSSRWIKTVHDIRDRRIRLEGGQQLRLLLRIEKVIANARDYALKRTQYGRQVNPHSPDFKEPGDRIPPPQAAIIPVPPGTYKLGVRVLLVRIPAGPARTKSLESEDVAVVFGAPSDPPE